MTTTTPLGDGVTCLQVAMQDEENDLRAHFHRNAAMNVCVMVGLEVRSAKLGTLYSSGEVRKACESGSDTPAHPPHTSR